MAWLEKRSRAWFITYRDERGNTKRPAGIHG